MNTSKPLVLIDAFKLLATAGEGPYVRLSELFSIPPGKALKTFLTTNLPPWAAALMAATNLPPTPVQRGQCIAEVARPAKVIPRPLAQEAIQRLKAAGYRVGIFSNAAPAYVDAFNRAFPESSTLWSACFWSCEIGHWSYDTPAIDYVQHVLRVNNPADILYISSFPLLGTAAARGWQVCQLDGDIYENPQAPLEDLLTRILNVPVAA